MCMFCLLLCDQKYIMYALCNNYIYTHIQHILPVGVVWELLHFSCMGYLRPDIIFKEKEKWLKVEATT